MDLLIHVGLHKTGTTTLQKTLNLGYSNFLRSSILYPRTGLFNSQHALIPGTLFSAHQALDSVTRSTDPKHYYALLEQEVKQLQPSLTILSSEVFSEITWNKEGCLEIIDILSRPFSDTRILLTLRDPQQQALSSVCHIIRDNMPGHRENPVGLYFNMLNCFRSWREFWHHSGLSVIERRLEDSRGSLVDYYIGDILGKYSIRARELLSRLTREQTFISPRPNADPFDPLIYLVAFILGNSSISPSTLSKASFQDIAKECERHIELTSTNKLVTRRNLIKYLDSLQQIEPARMNHTPLILSLESKIKAMTIAGLNPDAITQAISIANRVAQKYSWPG
jgi:hypothetical protein